MTGVVFHVISRPAKYIANSRTGVTPLAGPSIFRVGRAVRMQRSQLVCPWSVPEAEQFTSTISLAGEIRIFRQSSSVMADIQSTRQIS
jgi:hypothetical protein